MENKNYIPQGIIIIFISLIVLAILVTTLRADGLAGVSYGEYVTIKMPAIVANEEIIWSESMEQERIAQEKTKEKKPTKVTPKAEKVKESPKEVKIDTFDIDKLAIAVALHETGGCKKGNSASRNNCFGIMQWDKQGRRSFKSYKTKEDSYKDFKRIWEKYYKGLPNYAKAKKYSGNDRPNIWLENVLYFYGKQ